MLLATLVSVCAVAGLLFLLLAVRRLRHRRFGSCAIHGTSALVLFLAAVAIGLLGVNLLTYHRLTHEQPALEAQFKRAGDARYAAVLTYPSGETQELALFGDEWQVDAKVLKWTPFADILGFDTAYRLERMNVHLEQGNGQGAAIAVAALTGTPPHRSPEPPTPT